MMDLQTCILERYRKDIHKTGSFGCGSNLAQLCPRPGETLLDLGSGKGTEVVEAARMVGPSGQVYGIDLAPEAVVEATRNQMNVGVTNAEFLLGNLDTLPFGPESIDAVLSNCAINHAPDKLRVYREIFRVLKPGGRFVISDIIAREALPLEIRANPAEWADCFGGAVTEEQYLESILLAGFQEVTIVARREYLKKGYPLASLTLSGRK